MADAGRLTWWIHEVKVDKIVDPQLLQLQHNRPQVGPKDLRIRVILEAELLC